MKKLFTFAALLFTMIGNAMADDGITVATYGNATGNTTRTMTVALNGTPANYVACQFDLTLPAGTTVKDITAKAPLVNGKTVDLSAKGGTATESTDFKVAFNQDGNTCKVVAYNYGNEAMSGKSGDVLMTVKLETSSAVNYDAASVAVKDITFVKTDLAAAPTMAPVTDVAASKKLWGDVNESGSVDIVDVQLIANKIGGVLNSSAKFNSFSADINQVGGIDIVDMQKTANIVAGK